MSTEPSEAKPEKHLNVFERYLTLWVLLCIGAGVFLGRIAPDLAASLDEVSIHVGEAHVVSIPIAICLFFMMYPIMVKIDFAEVLKAGRNMKPVGPRSSCRPDAHSTVNIATVVWSLTKILLPAITGCA